jgi:putative transposase
MTQPLLPPRKKLRRREIENTSRFITFSCFRTLHLLGNTGIRDLLAERLSAYRQKHGFKLHAWVVMPNHAHFLVVPPEGKPLAPILQALKVSVAKTVIMRWKSLDAAILGKISAGGRPRFWQRGGGFDRNVRDEEEFCKEVTYIHRNPLEWGLVADPRA